MSEFRDDNLTDWAAALTYYAVLAIFPALIALISILGLIGASATDPLIDNLTELTPGPANDIITNAVNEITASQGTAGVAFVLGLAGALWSASGYVGAFRRASNVIYEIDEGRPVLEAAPAAAGDHVRPDRAARGDRAGGRRSPARSPSRSAT